jgi:hypothetical protein
MRTRFGSAMNIIFLACLCLCVLGRPHPAVAGTPGGEVPSEPDTLFSGEALYPDQGLTSTNSEYRLVYQGDGNLILYSYGTPLWASNTDGTAAGQAVMQHDGNFVVYDAYWNALRASNTDGYHGARLVVQNDGNVVIYTPEGMPLWDRYSAQWGGSAPPGPSSLTFIINGIESTGDWALPGTDFSNAIAATYGAVPEFWFWSSNSWPQVLPPFYSGIQDGAFQLANFLHSLPPGEVNLIAHSHGGNVVLLSQQWSTRPIRRYITMATPVNWDWYGWRFALDYGIAGRCQASSTADWVQLWGASPYQVGNFVYSVYQSIGGAYEAFQALINGNYEASFHYFAVSVFNAIQADYWLDTTRIEVEGPTFMFSSLGHTELHTPGAWNAIAPYCQ